MEFYFRLRLWPMCSYQHVILHGPHNFYPDRKIRGGIMASYNFKDSGRFLYFGVSACNYLFTPTSGKFLGIFPFNWSHPWSHKAPSWRRFRPKSVKIGRAVLHAWAQDREKNDSAEDNLKSHKTVLIWEEAPMIRLNTLRDGCPHRHNHVCKVSKRNFQGTILRWWNFPFYVDFCIKKYSSSATLLRCVWCKCHY